MRLLTSFQVGPCPAKGRWFLDVRLRIVRPAIARGVRSDQIGTAARRWVFGAMRHLLLVGPCPANARPPCRGVHFSTFSPGACGPAAPACCGVRSLTAVCNGGTYNGARAAHARRGKFFGCGFRGPLSTSSYRPCSWTDRCEPSGVWVSAPGERRQIEFD